MRYQVLILVLGFLILPPGAAQVRAAEVPASLSETEDLLVRLAARIPEEPAMPTVEILSLIEQVGATRRLDAAMILVRALAFSFSPLGQSETRSAFGSVPAAQVLKTNFGSQVLPILMFKGVTSKEGWLQTRLALTIREIGTAEDIQGLRKAFPAEESKDLVAKEFAARLAQKELSFADDPVLSEFTKLYKLYEEILEKSHQESKDKPRPPAGE
jgi:hypothetical protein